MNVLYELTMGSRCPVDGSRDHYTVKIHANRMLKVEDILAVCREYSGKAIFQEELTQALADQLTAYVTTYGVHSGVTTQCDCEPIGRSQ